MPLGTATTKTTSVTYFYLETYSDFGECLNACYPIGYIGTSSCFTDTDGSQQWRLLMNNDTQQSVTAGIGDVIVWDTIKLDIFDLATFQTRYNIVT